MTPNEILNKYYLARIIGWRHELELLDAEAVAELLKVLKAANNQLRERIAAELPEVWASYTPDNGGAAIRLWLGELLSDPAAQIENTITEGWSISAQQSLAAYNDILSINGLAKNVVPVAITMDQIRGLASKKLFAGFSLNELVGKAFSDGQIASIITSLDDSIKNGVGYQKAVKSLMDTAIDEGFEITRRQSITLARSYIQQASVNAQMAVYERNKDIVKGVKWCAILDNRICELCAATDGYTYTWDEEKPPMPRHPRCRCLWLPWTKSWRDLGIDADELEQAARPWLIREEGNIDAGGRKVLNFGTTEEDFPGWWKTLPYKEQIKSIGPVRTRLINEGKLTWKDLMNKNSGRFYTLEELGFTEGGKKIIKEVKFVSNEDFVENIKPLVNSYLKNGDLKEIVFEEKRKNYFMATNGRGTFWISGGKQKDMGGINLSSDFKNIWSKAASGNTLSLNEEEVIAAFWHEIIHNRQFGKPRSNGTKSDMLMELATEWTARRTYHEFLEKIGTKAIHQEDIINNGIGYFHRIKNFDYLCDKLGVDKKDDMLVFMKSMIENEKVKDYPKKLLDYISDNSNKKIPKKILNKALSLIQYSNFDYALKVNKINLE